MTTAIVLMWTAAMLFDFHLRPLEEVMPWGKPPNSYLSWFVLTDGFYRLQVGSEFLFNYSDDFAERWAAQSVSVHTRSFVDYYVVRLWEDLLEILPDVLEPLPLRFPACLRTTKLPGLGGKVLRQIGSTINPTKTLQWIPMNF
ncbi:MAG TPA: DUF5984 family protein [Thermosynechococcaceae cyanobacterium]